MCRASPATAHLLAGTPALGVFLSNLQDPLTRMRSVARRNLLHHRSDSLQASQHFTVRICKRRGTGIAYLTVRTVVVKRQAQAADYPFSSPAAPHHPIRVPPANREVTRARVAMREGVRWSIDTVRLYDEFA
jgi:hypothetical protein